MVSLGSGSPRVNEGAGAVAPSADFEVRELLGEILYQLKILNVHMSEITSMELKYSDVSYEDGD